MKVRLVGFAVSEDERITKGERTDECTSMKRLTVAFRNLYSNGTEERYIKMIKITIQFDAGELVTFVHLPGRSDSY